MSNVPVVALHDFCLHHDIPKSMMYARISGYDMEAYISDGRVWVPRSEAAEIQKEWTEMELDENTKQVNELLDMKASREAAA